MGNNRNKLTFCTDVEALRVSFLISGKRLKYGRLTLLSISANWSLFIMNGVDSSDELSQRAT